MRCLLICLASLWTITFAQAQTYQYRQYTTEDGLGHNQVFGIAEDSLGFMWFATDDGLYRFDGQDFYDMQRSDSRLRGSFTQLQKANDGGLWAGVYKKGVFKLSPGASNQYVERFFNIPISSDLIETESRLYTAIAKSIYRFEVDTTIIILFKRWFHDFFPEIEIEELQAASSLNRLFQLPNGEIKLINSFGHFNVRGDTVYRGIDSLEKAPLYCYGEGTGGDYWLGGEGLLYGIHEEQIDTVISHPDWQDREVHFVCQDSKQNLWISVKNAGVYKRSPQGQIQFMGDQIGLKNEFANYIYEDRSGSLWFATTNNGAFRVEQTLFEPIPFFPDEYNIKALGISDGQELWIGTGRQIYLLDEEDKGLPLLNSRFQGEIQGFKRIKDRTFVSIFLEKAEPKRILFEKVSPGLYGYYGSDITELDQNTVLAWFGASFSNEDTLIGPLRVWEILENGTFNPTKVFQYPEDIPWRTYQNNASIRNPDGSIWVAQNKGLYLWDTIPDFKQPAVLDHNSMDLMRLDDGSMLFATSRGLYRNESYRSRDLQLVYGGISARSLALDHKGRLWVGAQDGLYLFIEENGQFHIKARLMASQNINCLLFAPADQSLWIGTDQGLFRTSVEDAVAYHQQPPSIRITELITADSSYLFPHKVELPSDNNYLSFQISTLEFQTPSSLEVQYRLNGREWQELRGSELQFAAMADGKYQLDLQVSNDGLQWSEPARMIFEIAPPFWKSPWAYAVSSLLAIIMITLFSFRRIRNVKKREAEKRFLQKKLTELEQQALGAMMNPHFIFNTLNSIQHFFNQNDPAEANEYLARFAQLIRSNMEVVQKPQTLLDEELERLQLYLELEQLRFGDRMEYKVFVDPEIDPEEIMIPSMLMQPFVENAIWHGIAKSQELGWVEIRLEMIDDEILRIRIDDNGPGVFTSQNSRKSAHRSRGVEITRSRLHYYSPKSQLSFVERKDEDGSVRGTRVELRLPV